MADAEGNRYGPFDIEVPGSEAEAFTEDAWFDHMGWETGVVSGGELTFTGLTATLTAIDVRVHGSHLIRQDPWSAASDPTSGASPRRDMLVARRQRTSGEGEAAVPGKTFLTVLTGAPAATPADPPDDPDNDERLWSWQVPGGGGTVVTQVRDLRRHLLSNNAGTQGVLAGTAPPPGMPLKIKTYYASPSFNAFGDATVFYPGGAFPNGVVDARATHVSQGGPPSNNLEFVPWDVQLDRCNLRCYAPDGAVFGGTGVACILTLIGW